VPRRGKALSASWPLGLGGEKEDGDVASPCVGYLESFQSGLMLAVLRRDRMESTRLVQSHGLGKRSPASLPILGVMLMAESGVEDTSHPKQYCAPK